MQPARRVLWREDAPVELSASEWPGSCVGDLALVQPYCVGLFVVTGKQFFDTGSSVRLQMCLLRRPGPGPKLREARCRAARESTHEQLRVQILSNNNVSLPPNR